jgi:hypothetical protein
MSNGLRVLQEKRIFLIGLVILIVVSFIGYGFYMDYKAKQRYCQSAYSGRVTNLSKTIKGFTKVKLTDENWYHLSLYYNEKISKIEIGDSIVKESMSFNIFLISDGSKRKNITHQSYREMKCK